MEIERLKGLKPPDKLGSGHIKEALDFIKRLPPKRKSPKLTDAEREVCRDLLAQGHLQHDVASAFGVNQGRISEIKNGV